MRFSYVDLGEQRRGATVRFAVQGGRPNVILLDQVNFAAYRTNGSFRYHGGIARRRHSTLTVPHDGHWYLVVDFGGQAGRAQVSIQGIDPPSGPAGEDDRRGSERTVAVRG